MATFAVEGHYDLGVAAVTGQIGKTSFINYSYPVASHYARLGIDVELSPRMVLGVNVGLGTIGYPYSYPDVIYFYTYGVEFEYSVSDRFSLFASYQGSNESEPDEEEAWNKNSIILGGRLRFGASGKTPAYADYNPFTGVNNVRFNDWE